MTEGLKAGYVLVPIDLTEEMAAAARDAFLKDMRDRRLLKWLFDDNPANMGPIGYVDAAIDLEVQDECARENIGKVWSAALAAAPSAPDPALAAMREAATIVLVSQDRHGAPGYQLHGLFHTFADAARHVAKDQNLTGEQTVELADAWSKPGDRHESAEVGTWWVAARQPVRTALAASGEDRG